MIVKEHIRWLAAAALFLCLYAAAVAGQKTTVKLRLTTDEGTKPCDFFELLLSVDAATGKCGPSLPASAVRHCC